MATGYHDFVAGEQLTAANLESYCELQAVMQFASAAARTTALASVKAEGQIQYLQDVNSLQVYTDAAAASSTIGPVHGAMTTWTPVIVQGATPTITVNNAVYFRIGRLVWFRLLCTLSSAGTAANVVTSTLPVTALVPSGGFTEIGTGMIRDASAVLDYPGTVVLASGTTLKIQTAPSATDSYYGAAVFTAALATSDLVAASGWYEAAGDA